ncbi:FecR family protein [Sunxiuqinia sp. sy24]|uniref:FecR family protein n=1 Tax=Sunxiuqinia sp. sy24 TaxID=3461495 RepID=UPI0040456E7E
MTKKKDILKRYFSGKYSRKDFQSVLNLFFESKNQTFLETELKEHWQDFDLNQKQQEKDFSTVLNQVQHRIYLEENGKERKLKPILRLQRIAAILFIPLFLSFLGYYIFNKPANNTNAFAEIHCPEGTRTKFILPDGSSGYLNNGSKLSYPVPFNSSREVSLVGEAYFDVIQNGLPFHVKTKKLDIMVMGTTFNVIAYAEDLTEEVILQTGKVSVSSEKGKELTTLVPNQQLTLDLNSNRYHVRNVDAAHYTVWREGKLVFRNEKLENVAKRIERWYNIDIVIADEALKNYTYHATFMNHSLEELLSLLTFTSPMKFKLENQTINSNGDYIEKRKVTFTIDETKIKRIN